MDKVAKLIIKIEEKISKEKGGFVLFGLFLPDNTSDKYDLLVSANWIGSVKRKHFIYFGKQLRKVLSKDEINNISKIVILDTKNPFVSTVNAIFDTEHNIVVTENCSFNNVLIKRAYIITSKRRHRKK